MLQRFRLVGGVLRGDDRGWGAQAVFTGEVWGLRRGAGGQDPPVKRTGRVVIPLGTRGVLSPRDHPPMTPPHLVPHLTLSTLQAEEGTALLVNAKFYLIPHLQ